MGKILVKKIQ